jgi:Ca-activated chloride channel family protein
MKRDFDRNGFHLTDAERNELWQRINPAARVRAPWRPRLVPALATGAVALAAVALVMMNFPRRGADLAAPAAPPSITRSVPLSAAPAAPPQSVTVAPSAKSRRESAAAAPDRPDRTLSPADAIAQETAVGTATSGDDRVVAERYEPQVNSAVQEQRINGERLQKYAIDSAEDARARQAGKETFLRGGRTGDVAMRVEGAPDQLPPAAATAAPPATVKSAVREEKNHAGRLPDVVMGAKAQPTRETASDDEREFRARCWIPPRDPSFDAMSFRHFGVNPFVVTEADALSTFGLDVDNASYTMTRAFLERGELPPAAAVRVEECVNYFAQDYRAPADGDFRIAVDGAPSPFGEGYHLLRIGLRARDVRPAARRPAVLTFVIDVSGSMRREGRLELVKSALQVLLDELDANDTLGIVTYTTHASVALPPTPAARRALIGSVIAGLEPQNSTNVNEGLEYGYRMARQSFRPGAVNRIILCSDGVANESITVAEGILDDVRREADAGIHLTAIGVGMGNYNDVLLEKIADRGDGNYYYVDDLGEARRIFRRDLVGTLQTVARDAKVQVEFDPDAVVRWRLLGYENRAVADSDFRNDAVDAGEVGAGHQVTALYEVKLAPAFAPSPSERGARRRVDIPLGVVRLRYREPESEGRQAGLARELTRSISPRDLSRSFAAADPRLRLDAAVAEFAELLRGSYWARGCDMDRVARLADELVEELSGDAAVAEFARLARTAADLRRDDDGGQERK